MATQITAGVSGEEFSSILCLRTPPKRCTRSVSWYCRHHRRRYSGYSYTSLSKHGQKHVCILYFQNKKRGIYSRCFVNTRLCVCFWERKKIYIFFLWGCSQVGYSVQTNWPSSHSTSDLGNITARNVSGTEKRVRRRPIYLMVLKVAKNTHRRFSATKIRLCSNCGIMLTGEKT